MKSSWLFCAALLGAGCTTPTAITTCNPQCATGFSCVGGNCVFGGGGDLSVPGDGGAGCSPACAGPTPYCNGGGHCVACTTDDQCATGKYCKDLGNGLTACVLGCTGDARCGGGKCCNMQCADVSSDGANCGDCGKSCSAMHARAACMGGQCVAGGCDPGWGDCDGDPKNGCEANLHLDPANCSLCGMGCALAHAVNGCSDGCYISACDFGYDDCNGDHGDGCETQVLTDTSNCGGCGVPCNGLPNAAATCTDGNCVLGACAVGYANCNNVAQDGCEVKTATDAKNCGQCGNACGNGLVCINGGCTCQQCNFPNAASSCVNNVCVMGACVQGFADCNNSPNDGCEVNTAGDNNHCGNCGTICGNNLSCVNGVCSNVVCGTMKAPAFNQTIMGWAMAGLQFHALRNATLVSFSFYGQSRANTIRLVDVTAGNAVIGTVAVPAVAPPFKPTVNWPLVNGHVYHLTNDLDDGNWISYNMFPQSDAQIAVDGTWGNGAIQTAYWFSYSDLLTCG